MNKKIIGVIIVVCVVILGLILFESNYTTPTKDEPIKEVDNTKNDDSNSDNEIVESEDEKYTNKNQSVIELDRGISPKELFELEEDNYYVYFYLENCFGCNFINQYLNNVDLSNTPEIYRYNCNKLGSDDTVFYLDDEETAFTGYETKIIDLQNEEKLGILGTPTIIKVATDNNGERIATFFVGRGNICDELDDYTKVTYEEFELELIWLEESKSEEGSAIIDADSNN